MKYSKLLKITSIIVIFLMSISPAAAWVSVTVSNPTMNFGTVNADGTTVSTSSTISISGNENLDFYVRTNGPLTDAAGDTISNDPNFKFRIQYPQRSIDSGYVTLSNINKKVVGNWPKPNTGGADVATETYLLTVPPATPFGTYNTTVVFTVISSGITPTSLATTQVNDSSSNITNNSSDNITTVNTADITYTLLTLLEHYF
jgi:hypothetical protein